MKTLLYTALFIGLLSCSESAPETGVTDSKSSEVEMNPQTEYREIVLSENSLDAFEIPFPENNMLKALKEYYNPYWVEANIGEQDGPDYTYFDIRKDEDNPIAFLNFDPENKLVLDEIRIVSAEAKDEYGVRVGDSYADVIKKRSGTFENYTTAHQHTFLHQKGSHIYYEISGWEEYIDNIVVNIHDLILTEDGLSHCKVDAIIWRK